MLFKVQYIITILQIYIYIVAMGIEPATYVQNHNTSVVLPCFITLSQLLLIRIRNYDTTVGLRSCGKYKILGCVYRALSLVSTGYERNVQLQVRKLQWAYNKKIFLVYWVAYKAGMQCSVRSSSLATVRYSMKNLIACFYFSSDVQHSITTVQHSRTTLLESRKWEFARLLCFITHKNANFNFVVLRLMYHALTPAQSSYEQNSRALQDRTRSTLS